MVLGLQTLHRALAVALSTMTDECARAVLRSFSEWLVVQARKAGPAHALVVQTRKRPSSQFDPDDKEREQAQKERELVQKEREQAQKELELVQKERERVQKELELVQKKCSELQEQCSEAQRQRDFFRGEAQDLLRTGLQDRDMWLKMSGRRIDDLAEEPLEKLAEQIKEAKERVDAMLLRRKAEARVLAKHPDYACPISLALMRDPVVTADGQSYEHKEIEAWFETQREANEPLTSPLRAPLESAQLVCNQSLRRAIEAAVQAEQAII
jgi:hypothetical protein